MIDTIGFLSGKPVTGLQPKTGNGVGAADLAKDFGAFLGDALNKLNEQQDAVDKLNEKFVTGEIADVHMLTIAAEKVALGLELTVQIRNKAIEAYQEIMRTQI